MDKNIKAKIIDLKNRFPTFKIKMFNGNIIWINIIKGYSRERKKESYVYVTPDKVRCRIK